MTAAYTREVTIELDELVPVAPIRICLKTFIRSARRGHQDRPGVIGSCTNGRLEDLAAGSGSAQGQQVYPDVRCNHYPATQEIYMEAMKRGYIIFLLRRELL